MTCEYKLFCQFGNYFHKCNPEDCEVYDCFKKETDDLNDICDFGDSNDTGIVKRLDSQSMSRRRDGNN